MFARKILVAIVMLPFLSGMAQKTEERTISPFTRIECRGSLKVNYRHSDTLALSVKAAPEELERVTTSVDNGVLRLVNKGNFNEDVIITVSHNQLNGVEAEGATDFRTLNTIRGQSFDLKAGGAGNVDIMLEVTKVTAQVSGAASVKLEGKCESLDAGVSGAANLKAYQLDSKSAEVDASGAAQARVFASEKFHGTATGASSIKLKGEPKDMVAEASSAASINRVNDSAKKGSDTLTYNFKKKKVIIIDNNEQPEATNREKTKRPHEYSTSKFKHWRGLALGVNGYLNNGSATMPKSLAFLDLEYSRSFNLQLNLIERHFNLVRNHVKIVTGMGIDWHRYEFANKTTLDTDSSYMWGEIGTDPAIRFKKNRLRTTYLQVPLLFEFNTSNNPRRTFHLAAGVIGQYLIGHSSKQVFNDGADSYRINRSNHHLAPFAAKAHVNFGYRGWTIYAEYGLTTLFKNGMGPELYPFAAGLRVIPFT